MTPLSLATPFKSRFKDIHQEHKKIIDFADMIICEDLKTDLDENIISMLNRFEVLCMLHFLKEEQLLEDMKYPLLVEHKQLHKLLLTNMERYRISHQKRLIANKLSDFSKVREDIVTHMLNESMLLSQFIATINSCDESSRTANEEIQR